jgi:hypothetical protein
MCINPFTGEAMLAAGGSVRVSGYSDSTLEYYEHSVELPGGTTSAGKPFTGANAGAIKGTLPGCGGGGVALSNTSGGAVMAANGADGAVIIYVINHVE